MDEVPSTTSSNIEPLPILHVAEGSVFTNSRDVAAFFGKEHRNVLSAVDTLLEQEADLGLLTFKQTPYVEPSTGQQYRSYEMTRDGFSLLAMGFNGAKALKWKLRYIEAFNKMEGEIRRQTNPGPMLDMNDPAALRGLLLSYSEKAIELQAQVNDLIPSKRALDRISASDGSLCITESAKALQLRPKDLFEFMRQNGWLYRRAGAAHDLGYQSKVVAGLLEHKVTTVTRSDGSEKITEQVRITPKGLTKLALVLHPAARAA